MISVTLPPKIRQALFPSLLLDEREAVVFLDNTTLTVQTHKIHISAVHMPHTVNELVAIGMRAHTPM